MIPAAHPIASRTLAVSTTWKVKSGSYIGTGASLGITGLGFRPQLIIIKATGNTGNDDPVMGWSGMASAVGVTPAAVPIDPTATPITGMINGYDVDGFTLGTHVRVNTLNQQYYWFAFAGSSAEIQTGSYTGTGTDNRDITGVTFQPKMVFVKRRNVVNALGFRHEGMTGDFSYGLGSTNNGITNAIQAINPDGFQVGTQGFVNAVGAPFDYIAFNPPSGYGYFSAYTGNGVDNTDITGVPFQPEIVLIKGNTTVESIIRGLVNTGDNTSRLQDSSANAGNRIQQFNSDGFQLGTATEANSATTLYHYAAFRTT